MNPEVAQLEIHKPSSCRRHKDLAAVSSAHDPSSAVDIDPDIPILREEWFASVNTDPNACPNVSERLLCLVGGEDCVARRANAKKKASPCVSTSTPSSAAQASRMTCRCSARVSAYSSAPSPQEPRRSLDICEDERNGACREIVSHSSGSSAGAAPTSSLHGRLRVRKRAALPDSLHTRCTHSSGSLYPCALWAATASYEDRRIRHAARSMALPGHPPAQWSTSTGPLRVRRTSVSIIRSIELTASR